MAPYGCVKALVFDLEDAVSAAKEGYPRILALVQDTLEVGSEVAAMVKPLKAA